ncbi:hypothetical protein HanHA300_Chr13g0463911 [Helianthus annuus]|nr:hypothetical protein HanHA300_Chr13g0463911 [Helianthus annuus]
MIFWYWWLYGWGKYRIKDNMCKHQERLRSKGLDCPERTDFDHEFLLKFHKGHKVEWRVGVGRWVGCVLILVSLGCFGRGMGWDPQIFFLSVESLAGEVGYRVGDILGIAGIRCTDNAGVVIWPFGLPCCSLVVLRFYCVECCLRLGGSLNHGDIRLDPIHMVRTLISSFYFCFFRTKYGLENLFIDRLTVWVLCFVFFWIKPFWVRGRGILLGSGDIRRHKTLRVVICFSSLFFRLIILFIWFIVLVGIQIWLFFCLTICLGLFLALMVKSAILIGILGCIWLRRSCNLGVIRLDHTFVFRTLFSSLNFLFLALNKSMESPDIWFLSKLFSCFFESVVSGLRKPWVVQGRCDWSELIWKVGMGVQSLEVFLNEWEICVWLVTMSWGIRYFWQIIRRNQGHCRDFIDQHRQIWKEMQWGWHNVAVVCIDRVDQGHNGNKLLVGNGCIKGMQNTIYDKRCALYRDKFVRKTNVLLKVKSVIIKKWCRGTVKEGSVWQGRNAGYGNGCKSKRNLKMRLWLVYCWDIVYLQLIMCCVFYAVILSLANWLWGYNRNDELIIIMGIKNRGCGSAVLVAYTRQSRFGSLIDAFAWICSVRRLVEMVQFGVYKIEGIYVYKMGNGCLWEKFCADWIDSVWLKMRWNDNGAGRFVKIMVYRWEFKYNGKLEMNKSQYIHINRWKWSWAFLVRLILLANSRCLVARGILGILEKNNSVDAGHWWIDLLIEWAVKFHLKSTANKIKYLNAKYWDYKMWDIICRWTLWGVKAVKLKCCRKYIAYYFGNSMNIQLKTCWIVCFEWASDPANMQYWTYMVMVNSRMSLSTMVSDWPGRGKINWIARCWQLWLWALDIHGIVGLGELCFGLF